MRTTGVPDSLAVTVSELQLGLSSGRWDPTPHCREGAWSSRLRCPLPQPRSPPAPAHPCRRVPRPKVQPAPLEPQSPSSISHWRISANMCPTKVPGIAFLADFRKEVFGWAEIWLIWPLCNALGGNPPSLTRGTTCCYVELFQAGSPQNMLSHTRGFFRSGLWK